MAVAKRRKMIIVQGDRSGAGFQIYGGARDAWFDNSNEVCLSGPAECLDRKTVLDGTQRTVGEFYEGHDAPLVETLRGRERASVPFLKGHARLYRVATASGSFLATRGHLVFTQRGFVRVGALLPGEYLLEHSEAPQWNRIVSVKYEKTDDHFDLTVPEAGHYFANGFLHHNTGKTRPGIEKLHAVCIAFDNVQALMLRKVRADLRTSGQITYERLVLGAWDRYRLQELKQQRDFDPDAIAACFDPESTPVQKFGGVNPDFYLYPNGSRIYLRGLDSPGKVLSSEWDHVYVQQAEQLFQEDYEMLTTRVTGRARHVPWPQIFLDVNPSHPRHHILQRTRLGHMQMHESRHKDNPTLYNQDKKMWTPQGLRTLAVLDRLTGANKERLRFGRWVQAEGVVFESFDARKHILPRNSPKHGLTGNPRSPIPRNWRRIRVIDFGYVNPFCCQWWAIGPDSRMFMYREIYMTGRTVSKWAPVIKELTGRELIECTICDHDREDRETLHDEGIITRPAYKAISVGIEAVEDRLGDRSDKTPGLFFLEGSVVERDMTLMDEKKPTCTTDEMDVYIWNDATTKEVPVDKDNHGCDCTRYAVCFVDGKGYVHEDWSKVTARGRRI